MIDSNHKLIAKSVKVNELEKLLKLFDIIREMSLKKMQMNATIIDRHLYTTIKLIITYSQTFTLNERLKHTLK